LIVIPTDCRKGNDINAHPHNLRFCKTPQAETDASRFIGKTVCVCFKLRRFTENSESANYDGGKYIKKASL